MVWRTGKIKLYIIKKTKEFTDKGRHRRVAAPCWRNWLVGEETALHRGECGLAGRWLAVETLTPPVKMCQSVLEHVLMIRPAPCMVACCHRCVNG